jgi:hypothetical protein
MAIKLKASHVRRASPGSVGMTGLILEALLALFILLIIVWWTMFSGRPRGELAQQPTPHSPEKNEVDALDKSPSQSSVSARKD